MCPLSAFFVTFPGNDLTNKQKTGIIEGNPKGADGAMEEVGVYRESDGTAFPRRPVAVAIGMFDGVHIAHQALLRRLCELASACGAAPVVFTFSENPKRAQALSDEAERLELFSSLGVSGAYIADYGALRGLSCAEFAQTYLRERLDCRAVAVGSDFRFGKDRAGDCETMRTLFPRTEVLPPVLLDGVKVSSTEIRRRLLCGDVEGAGRMLGRPYGFCLPVRRGRSLARELGFPTLNQVPPEGRVLPRFGVYETEVFCGGGLYRGVTNVGVKPTVTSDGLPLLETHLLGYSGGELYGETVRVSFLRMLREERRFETVEALRAQMARDIRAVEAAKEERNAQENA